MNTRFHKSKKIAPGVTLNLGKKSASVRFGGKGAGVTLNTKGKVTSSAGIPGTGLHFSESKNINSANESNISASPNASIIPDEVPTFDFTHKKTNSNKGFKFFTIFLLIIFLFYFSALIILNANSNAYLKYSFFTIQFTAPSYSGISVSEVDVFNKNMTLNSDGSVTCKLYYWEYSKLKNDLQSFAKSSLQKMATADGYEAFLGVKTNNDLKDITLTVDQYAYENNLGAADVSSCVYPAFLYRVFCNDKIDKDIINIHLLDADGNSVGDYSYPFDFNLYEIFLDYFESAFSFNF